MPSLHIKKIFSYLIPHIKKHKVSFSLIFIGYTVGIIFGVLVRPYLFKEIIDVLSSSADKTSILKEAFRLSYMLVGVVCIYLVGYRLGDYAVGYFESKVMKRLYDTTLEKLLNHSYTFFSNNFSGSLIAKSKRFIKAFELLADVISFQLWFSFVITIGVITILLIKVPDLGLLFLGWVVVYILVTLLFIKKKISYDIIEAEADSSVIARLSDIITNVFTVKIFSAGKKEVLEFKKITEDEQSKRLTAWNFGNLQNAVQAFLMAILQIVFIFYFIDLWKEGKVTIGTLVMIQAYLMELFDNLWGLGRSITKAMKALSEMKEIIDIFEQPLDVADSHVPVKFSAKEGSVLFDNVTFSYKNGISLFKNFTLEIKAGEKVGIVGHSGAGKSSLTKILLRFLDINEGAILIDGQNINSITQDDLRNIISYVPQESMLFHRTIKENIAYSNPDATDEEIVSVAKKAYAHNFIDVLPKKYDTLVGERGIKLSGGERQRVAIARAMIKKSPILVLDEATSSLDSISEKYIQQAFVELMKNKTAIVIAHRLSTLQKMDRIIVIDNGKIVESGTHKELLDQNGIYASLWSHQSGGFIAA